MFWEQLCNGDQETDGLCKTCLRYRDSEDPKVHKKWHGLITEEPLPESHMLGTAWAAKCKWTGAGPSSAPVSSAASVASEASESGQTPAPVSAATVAPMEAAAKKVRAPRKKKEAVATAAVTLATAVVTPATVAPAAVSTTEPVADAGELRMLQGEFYWVVGSNVYEYDQIEETPGDFVGRVRADETIDGDAEEEGAAESDGE